MQDDGYFGARIAATYDADEARTGADVTGPAIDLLAFLAGSGPVLEFAIGTGRLALPLAARGIDVSGIELSQAMIDVLRGKPGGAALPVLRGDMASAKVDAEFPLVFLAFNTICNLTSQAAQVACFRNAAAHLAPGGRFLIEVQVPPLQRLPFGETLLAFARDDTHWGMDEIDVVTQRFQSHHLWQRAEGPERRSLPFRYVWPSELDLMAELAGLALEHRWQDWDRTPLTNRSEKHVSVWRKPG